MIQQISQEQYKLLLNNRNFFQDIECIKKVKNKIYVNFVKDISDIQKFNILENNNYYLSSKHKWIDVSYGRHNIIMNPNNPNILINLLIVKIKLSMNILSVCAVLLLKKLPVLTQKYIGLDMIN